MMIDCLPNARWAAEIHDGLAQTVAAAILELQVLDAAISCDPDEARRSLGAVTDQLFGAMADVREVLFHLTDESEATADIQATLASARTRWDIAINVRMDPRVEALDLQVRNVTCMVLQEAIANAATHAKPTHVDVTLSADADRLRVVVADAGPGLQPPSHDRHHFGLRILEHRIQAAGGTLWVGDAKDGGTELVATLPISKISEKVGDPR